MQDEYVIDVKNLSKKFNDKVVVNHIDLKVKKGEVFGFLGPNGSGKTTTIRMICGLLTPDSGQGSCLGYDILTQSLKIKEKVGYMTQHFSFYTDLTIEENLNFIANVYEIKNSKHKVLEILKEHGLLSRRNQLTGTLSGGWKQRVALAACLLHEPKMLLLDEPTSGIDPIARREFWDRIHALSEKGVTTLMATHYMDEAERCTRLAYLAYGQMLIAGTVDEVIDSTHLKTWEISGQVTTGLLQVIKNLPGISQAALFGRQIHVSGYNVKLIEDGLYNLKEKYDISYKLIKSTLEDAFISLVAKTTQGEEESREEF